MPKPRQLDMFAKATQDEGRRRRDQAKARLADNNSDWLHRARERMVQVIRDKGECSSDDCWAFCPPPADAHPSVMGCLFDDRRFIRTGSVLTKRPEGRARRISVYELKDEPNAGIDQDESGNR